VTDNCGNQTNCTAPVTVGLANSMITGYALQPDGFHIKFATQPGFIYAVEYTDTLFPIAWVSLPALTGDGAIHEVVDPTPLGSARFYRLERLCP
jgi:hypothetical protein